MSQQTLETWDMKMRRLALELKAVKPTDESPSAKQRLVHRRLHYEIQLHLDAVTEAS